MFYLCYYQKENTPHVRLSRSRLAGRPLAARTDARAARLAKFKREQLIVDDLNRGVSVAEIAARVGIGEKRMRAVIREILARRMPAPPEEFLAIQVSRPNEALLVAFSAMGPTNLKAVDQVVKIVRELDRYHGFAAAQRRLPEAPRSEALADGTSTYGAEFMCQASYVQQGFDDIDFDSIALPLGEGRLGASAGDDRPEIPPQALEKTDSAPGNSEALLPLAPLQWGEGWPPELIRGDGPGRLAAGDDRPENQPQSPEKIDSAPGTGRLAEAASAPREAAFDGPMILTPTGWKPATMRMLQNGVAT